MCSSTVSREESSFITEKVQSFIKKGAIVQVKGRFWTPGGVLHHIHYPQVAIGRKASPNYQSKSAKQIYQLETRPLSQKFNTSSRDEETGLYKVYAISHAPLLKGPPG